MYFIILMENWMKIWLEKHLYIISSIFLMLFYPLNTLNFVIAEDLSLEDSTASEINVEEAYEAAESDDTHTEEASNNQDNSSDDWEDLKIYVDESPTETEESVEKPTVKIEETPVAEEAEKTIEIEEPKVVEESKSDVISEGTDGVILDENGSDDSEWEGNEESSEKSGWLHDIENVFEEIWFKIADTVNNVVEDIKNLVSWEDEEELEGIEELENIEESERVDNMNISDIDIELSKARENLNQEEIIWEETYNGVKVTVNAPIESFPVNTKLKITPINQNIDLEDIKDKISETEDVSDEVVAFDISFLYILESWEEIELQPLEWKTVEVSFDYTDNDELKKADDTAEEQLKLFHVKDKDEEWNIVEEENQVVEEITINSEKTTEWEIVADVSAFSIYVIIKTPLLGDILVHYDAGEWKFTGNVQTFDVTYSLNNSNYVPNKTSQQPNKAWKMFAGWFLDQDLTNRWDWVSSDTTSSEFTVYAKYLDFVDATYTFGGISFTMMDRNLWATSNNISSEDSYWYYYQWWNNYGFENQWNVAASSTDLVVNNSSFPRWPSNYYSNGTFVSRSASPFRWESVNTDNLWGWTSTKQSDRRWPCPEGYHIPTSTEWNAAYESFLASWNTSEDFASVLSLPSAGYRYRVWASLTSVWDVWYYWGADAKDSDSAYALTFDTDATKAKDYKNRSYWNSVRCFKDAEPVTITFDSNGWAAVEPQTFNWYEARTSSLKPIVSNDSGLVARWFRDSDLTQEFLWTNTSYVSEDTTLYAKYGCEDGYTLNTNNECVLRVVTVTYKVGDTTYWTATYTRNDLWQYLSKTQIQNPDGGAYKMFDGWYLDEDLTNKWKFPEDNDSLWEAYTVYAKFLPFEDLTVDFGDRTIVIMDRNLWATSTGTNSVNSYWYYFQFWNNYGFPTLGSWTNITSHDITNPWSNFQPGNYYTNWLFITWAQRPITNSYPNIWWWYESTKNPDTSKQWPCPAWYHIPEQTEMKYLYDTVFSGWKVTTEGQAYCAWLSNGKCFAKKMQLPLWWNRNHDTAEVENQWELGYYWVSTYYNYENRYAWKLNSNSFANATTASTYWTDAFSVRCFKDTNDHYVLSFDAKWWTTPAPQQIRRWNPYSNATSTRAWSIFSGWYYDSWYQNAFTWVVTENTTVYANWDCMDWYTKDDAWNCISDSHIVVTFIANPSGASAGHFPDSETTKQVSYKLTTGWYFAAEGKEIQVPELADNMFEWWYTDTDYAAAHRWAGLSWGTTYTEITLYARYLPFEDKTVTWWWATFTIMDRNLGATAVSSWYSYNVKDLTTIGNYYQWWNNFWFVNNWTLVNKDVTNMVSNHSEYQRWPGNYYFNGTFIRRPDTPYRWDDADDRNLWWWKGESADKANPDSDKQWPCPEGYHVPSTYEWLASRNLFQKWQATEEWMAYCNSIHATNTWTQFCMLAALGMPFAGYRNSSSSSVSNQGTYAFYWSSTAYSANTAYTMNSVSSWLTPQYWISRAFAFSLRCFRDSGSLTLTFDSNWGSSIPSQTWFKRWNPRETAPTVPSRIGSTFVGWYTDKELTQSFTFSDTTYVSEDTTLYAKWTCARWYHANISNTACEQDYIAIGIDNASTGTSVSITASSENNTITQTLDNLFRVEDMKWSSSGYYTTISASDLVWTINGKQYSIPKSNISLKVNMFGTISWKINGQVTKNSKFERFYPLGEEVMFIKRESWTEAWLFWKYWARSSIQIAIPAYTPVTTYKWTITYTLYDNA